MQPILIHIHAQSHSIYDPERLTELLNGILRSEGMQLETVEFIKVAALHTTKRRVRKLQSKAV
jgi:hypothetical protein